MPFLRDPHDDRPFPPHGAPTGAPTGAPFGAPSGAPEPAAHELVGLFDDDDGAPPAPRDEPAAAHLWSVREAPPARRTAPAPPRQEEDGWLFVAPHARPALPAGPPVPITDLDAAMDDVRARVAEVFGFDDLRPMQADAMRRRSGPRRDSSCCRPAAARASVTRRPRSCAAAHARREPADRADEGPDRALDSVGIAAGAFNSGQDPLERNATWERLRRRELQLVYCSPERIVSPGFYQDLLALGASAVAVDEAHCISHWGHDFRPEYRQLGALRGSGARVPILALTATATPRVQEDIVRQLGLVDEVKLVGDFDRPNLTYRITPRKDQVDQTCCV
jgi:hypothetical protein